MAAGHDALSSAKEALSKANSFTNSVAKEADKVAPRTMHSDAPKHEFSSAPYSIVKEASDAGKGIKVRMETEAKTHKALQ